jgi:hypothetical protein
MSYAIFIKTNLEMKIAKHTMVKYSEITHFWLSLWLTSWGGKKSA